MSERTAYRLGPDEGEARWGLDGSLSVVKTSGVETAGWLGIVEETAAKSEGIPLHAHPADDEAFYVLAGELTFYLGEDRIESAPAGSFVHIPGGAPHAFKIESDTARYLILTTPRHLEFYRAISDPALSRTVPTGLEMDMERIGAACEEFGVEFLGPPPFNGSDGR